jgi:hypothetical protein
MNDIDIALREFWGSFKQINGNAVPAFLEGYALTGLDERGNPRRPDFPFITYPVVRTDWGEPTVANSHIWARHPQQPGFRGTVNHIAEQVANAILPNGIIIVLDNLDFIKLSRSNPFINYLDEPEDPAIVRTIVHYQIQIFKA